MDRNAYMALEWECRTKTQQQLAQEFGVSVGRVSQIIRRTFNLVSLQPGCGKEILGARLRAVHISSYDQNSIEFFSMHELFSGRN